jgi:hypothetical protein
MKILNNTIFITIILICIFIFAFYNIIIPVYNSSLVLEGFDNNSSYVAGADAESTGDINQDNIMYTGNASNSSPFDYNYDTSNMPTFKSMFGKKCLLGCVSPTSSVDVDNSRCKQNASMDFSSKKYRKCPWKCVPDILDKHPELKSVYAPYTEKGYPICKKEMEERHCSGCSPDAYF